MSLRFIYGKPGSGKTEYCMRDAAKSGKRARILVPEQYSHTAERRLAGIIGVFGADGADVKSFGQLSRELLKTKTGISLRHIDKGGKTMLVYKILYSNQKDLKLLSGKEINKASEIQRLLAEFKRYGVSWEFLKETADKAVSPRISAKLSDLALVYKKYEEHLSGKFIDGDDNLSRAAAELQNGEFLKDSEIYITDFSRFTPSELMCIKLFLQHADRVSVALSMPENASDETQYMPLVKTRQTLLNMAKELAVAVEPPVTASYEREKSGELSFLCDNYFKYDSKPYEKAPQDISIFEAQNPRTEVMRAAAEIRRLCCEKKYKFRDIALLCGDTDTYLSYAKIVFPKYGIPFFPDSKVKVLSHPVIAFVLSALETVAKDFSKDAFLRYAKSEFSGVSFEKTDILENYILAAGIRPDALKSDAPWEIRCDFYSDSDGLSEREKQELQQINEIRFELTKPLLELDKNLKAGKTVEEKCKALFAFTEKNGLCQKAFDAAERLDKAGDKYAAAEYRAVYNKYTEALDEACGALGESVLSAKHFYEILSVGFEEFEIGLIPVLADGVRFGNIARLPGRDTKVLFILGANDGSFPIAPVSGGFLTDGDRTILAEGGLTLAPDAITQSLEGDNLLSEALASPAKRLFLSFSGSDFEGRAKRPSIFINRVKELFPKILHEDEILDRDKNTGILPYDVLRLRAMSAPRQSLTENVTAEIDSGIMQTILGENLITSVSRLERYAACPFSYFMQYTLGAKERRIAELSPMDAGSFMHSFLEIFSRRLSENGMSWKNIEDNYIDSEADIIMDIINPRLNKYILGASSRTAHLFVRLKNCLKSSVRFISNQIKCGLFIPSEYEVTFGANGKIKPLKIPLSDGKTVSLTGKIDRVDTYSDGKDKFVRITDYKSGNKSFNLLEVFYGISLQLGVYLQAYCENDENAKPAGMLYFKLDDSPVEGNKLDEDAINKQKIKNLSISGLLVDDLDVVSNMDLSGKFEYLPVKIKKDGNFDAYSKVASAKNFKNLFEHIKKTVASLTEEIYSGKTDIMPYKGKCDYCAYTTVCRFDKNGCRVMEKLEKEEIWKEMARENGN
ncbi:MAG: PD-(D/E)XK nuclease family protein [Clostridia bacterium]|nr:PD-(D/E)XK nuclease family protein [Clostridia bacterium]